MNTNFTFINGLSFERIEDLESWLDSLDVPDITLVDNEMNLWAIANGYIHPSSSDLGFQA